MSKKPEYIKLIGLLKLFPKSKEEAQLMLGKAMQLAVELDIPIVIRGEGIDFRDGLNIYPEAQQKYSIGAMFHVHRKVYGWRWSITLSQCEDWSTGDVVHG